MEHYIETLPEAGLKSGWEAQKGIDFLFFFGYLSLYVLTYVKLY